MIQQPEMHGQLTPERLAIGLKGFFEKAGKLYLSG